MHHASDKRYESMKYNRCGRSGLLLPAISLGCWQNFTSREAAQTMLTHAFDRGITHFDLANNYGPPPGIAEENVGSVLASELKPYRDELIISSKAGYNMWPGPYGEWGSKKYLVASLDQSLKRLQIPYVDIFYSHRFDPNTPLEETMGALDLIVRQGKALYVGISNYDPAATVEAAKIMQQLGTPLTIHQPSYSMFNRNIENGVLSRAAQNGLGMIVFSPLQQGILTDKYLSGIPAESRAGGGSVSLSEKQITPEKIEKVRQLNEIAQGRGQSMAQLALQWAGRDARVTSVLIGARNNAQIDDSLAALDAAPLSTEELARIDQILQS